MIAAARSLVGVPYKHRGRTERGVDCIGLVAYAVASVGREIADQRAYSPRPTDDSLRQALRAHLGEPVSDMKPGDVLLLGWHEMPCHVGLVAETPYGELSLIHSLHANGRVIEHRLADPWLRRIREVYRP